MELVTLMGNISRLGETLQVCIDSGAFHPETAIEHISSLKHYSRLAEDTTHRQLLDQLIACADSAGKKPSVRTYDPTMTNEFCREQINRLQNDFENLRNELETLNKEMEYCNACMTQLEHFDTMDINLQDLFDCEFLDIRFGRLPASSYQAAVNYTQTNKNAVFVPFSTDDDYCWGMYLTPKEYAEEVDLTFAVLYFERLHIPQAVAAPADAIEQLKEQMEPDRKRIEEIQSILGSYWDGQEHIYDQIYSYLTHQIKMEDIRKFAAVHGEHFVVIGWIPQKDLPAFEQSVKALGDIDITVTESEHVKAFSPPVRLKNPFFAKPFEFYTKMFGMPTYGEVDPTAFVAITYTLLYGIMFADLGQGLVLAIIGYFFMYKKMGNPLGRLLLPCGLSGAFFGLVFGSVFGYEHLLDPMFHAMGFEEKPIEIMDSENIMMILFAAVGIGVVLMLAALLVNVYSRFKRKQIGAALFHENGLTGFILYLSAILLVLKLLLKLPVPTAPLLWIGIVPMVAILWLKEPLEKLADGHKNWQPESWGGYLTQGFFELFEALLSYVTNTVSFLRVGAFVLVHASMMMVFSALAEMAGGAVGIIIMVFGNVFVIALEGLLVGVQGLRLEFYEMFNRFFEGAGREFHPLKKEEL
jgi:V/A-type H+-transporting ATPase subunit I